MSVEIETSHRDETKAEQRWNVVVNVTTEGSNCRPRGAPPGASAHLDGAVVVLGDGLGFEVTLQIAVEVILQETLQSFAVAPEENTRLYFT